MNTPPPTCVYFVAVNPKQPSGGLSIFRTPVAVPVMFGSTPNITGEIDGPGFPEKFSNIPFSGAISASRNGSYSGRGGGNVNLIVEFSAEKSNSIYGKNTTVQPPALQSLACIKT